MPATSRPTFLDDSHWARIMSAPMGSHEPSILIGQLDNDLAVRGGNCRMFCGKRRGSLLGRERKTPNYK
jgi:hypothetical protein